LRASLFAITYGVSIPKNALIFGLANTLRPSPGACFNFYDGVSVALRRSMVDFPEFLRCFRQGLLFLSLALFFAWGLGEVVDPMVKEILRGVWDGANELF
jgi:hypothetical protein